MVPSADRAVVVDPLTGVPTRARLAAAIAGLKAAETPFALMVIDVDHFKSVNDAFGHARGDAVLVEVVGRLRSALRDGDDLFRYGGDEFVLLVREAGPERAEAVGRRLLDAVRGRAFEGAPPLTVTLSIGAACFPGDAVDDAALFERADQRLLASKRRGRDVLTAEDTPAPPDGHADGPARLIARDGALERARAAVLTPGDGVAALRVVGPRGAGFSAFLDAVGRIARAAGRSTLHLRPAPGTRFRALGALDGARLSGERGEITAEVTAARLRAWAEASRAPRVVLIDDVAAVDEATRALLAEHLADARDPVTLVVAAPDGDGALLPAGTRPVEVALAPFDPESVRQWARGALRWEAPAAFIDWLWRHTGGLPARLERLVGRLRNEGVLAWGGGGWVLRGAWRSAPAASWARPPAGLDVAGPDGLLVGRCKMVRRIAKALREGETVSLVGGGGVGKSRLAQQVALEVGPGLREGARVVVLGADGAHTCTADALAQALHLEAPDEPWAAVVDHLVGWAGLLVVDGADAAPDLRRIVDAVRARRGAARLLLTSRAPLHLAGEIALTLGGLDCEAGAVALFRARARRAGCALDDGPAVDDAIAAICRLVGGLPLALELAAAWTPLVSLEALAAAIRENLGFLEQAPGHTGGLRSVLDWFWSQLGEAERRAVYALAVFRGPFTAEDARAVAEASPFLLLGLLDRAVIARRPDGRYEMQDLLAQDARARLQADAALGDAVARRHAGRVDAGLEALAPALLRSPGAAFGAIEADLDNLLAAWRWLVATGDPDDVLRRWLAPLESYLEGRQRLRLGLELFESAERAFHAVDRPALRAALAAARCRMLFRQGRLGEAEVAAREGVARLPPDAPAALVGQLHNRLGAVLQVRGDRPGARGHFERALEALGGQEDDPSLPSVLGNLGRLAQEEGDLETAVRCLEACVDRARAQGDRRSVAASLNSLGVIAYDAGQLDRASALFHESLEQCRAIGFPVLEVYVLAGLAEVAQADGDHELALARAERAGRLAAEGGNLLMQVHADTLRGRSLGKLGRDDDAEASLRAALQRALALGSPPPVLRALGVMAERAAARGQAERARALAGIVWAHPATDRPLRAAVEPIVEQLGGIEPMPDAPARLDAAARAALSG
ncbi:MAG: diguanylate cyclase [Myxococcales bacterium]|nr:diguanylate cyclase [Myxococcales bacterium]